MVLPGFAFPSCEMLVVMRYSTLFSSRVHLSVDAKGIEHSNSNTFSLQYHLQIVSQIFLSLVSQMFSIIVQCTLIHDVDVDM